MDLPVSDIQGRLDKIKQEEPFDLNELREKLVCNRGLSLREVDVFFVIGSGVTNYEAGKMLFICEGTIKFHLTNIFKKLSVKSRPRIVLMAHGLLPV